MPICRNPKYIGKRVLMEYAIGCGDTLPQSSEWNRVGAMNTKDFGSSWDTDDSTADDSPGSIRENQATFQNITISGDGKNLAYGPSAAALTALKKHQLQPIATGGQPSAWFRLTFPDITITVFMLITQLDLSSPFDATATYSFEASSTASEIGILVEDTPDPDAVDVASVTLAPSTATMEVGDAEQLSAIVAPATAHQVVYFTSSNPDVATITPQGLVRAISAGPATITARAATDSSKTATCVVTVS